MAKGKKQIAKLSKRQIGHNIGQQLLSLLSGVAADVKGILEKGAQVNKQTGQTVPIPCTPTDVKSAFTPEQLGAIEEFVSTFYVEPEPPPKPE